MNRYYIDEIIERLIEMRKDGYRYCEVFESEADNEYNISAHLSFSGVECGGLGLCDYDSIDCVSDDEILKYGDLNIEPPKNRIKIDFEDTAEIEIKL
nr:unnamed protein product [uncultured bacterium]